MSDEAAAAPTDAPAQSETISIPVATFIEDVGKHLEGVNLPFAALPATPADYDTPV